MRKLLFVAIDVDDTQWSFCTAKEKGKEFQDYKCLPKVQAFVKVLKKLGPKEDMRICYEATHIGFTLYRQLRKRGYICEVIAPSLIPQKPGDKVKTNRLDARKLVDFFRTGHLTAVHVPDAEEEHDRDLLRSRKFLADQLARLKKHVTSLCRRSELDYKKGEKSKHYWTKEHRRWLKQQAEKSSSTSLKTNLKILIGQIEQLEISLETYGSEVLHLAESDKYRKKVRALRAYRGIDNTLAMTFITEIGDPNRFEHPRRITSYSGFDLIEYSTGKNERKFRISKDGNKHLRTASVEACQFVFHPINPNGKQFRAKRKGTEPELIKIADRCMERLRKKGNRLLHRNKLRNKAVVACARELQYFILESLKAAA